MCECLHLCAQCPQRPEDDFSFSVSLELQQWWDTRYVLCTEPGFTPKAAGALKPWASLQSHYINSVRMFYDSKAKNSRRLGICLACSMLLLLQPGLISGVECWRLYSGIWLRWFHGWVSDSLFAHVISLENLSVAVSIYCFTKTDLLPFSTDWNLVWKQAEPCVTQEGEPVIGPSLVGTVAVLWDLECLFPVEEESGSDYLRGRN